MRDVNNDKESYLNNLFPIDDGNKVSENIDYRMVKPKRLYKYMNLKEDVDSKLKSIKEGYIWMTNANELNDPFECILKLPENINCSIFNDFYNEIYSIKKRYEKFLTSIKKETYITAFSENNKSLLMWSHYADSHKGICVEYSFDDLENCQKPELLLVPVIYKNLFISIGNPKNKEELNNRCIQAFSRKSDDWSYENEWRLIKLYEKEYKKGLREKIIKPKCIYLGINIDNELRNKIELYFKDTEISIKYMMTKCYEYSIDSIEDCMEEYKYI